LLLTLLVDKQFCMYITSSPRPGTFQFRVKTKELFPNCRVLFCNLRWRPTGGLEV
jgi:hypothetical protein